MPQNARDIAVQSLLQWERENTYVNIMLDQILRTSALSSQDNALVTRLVYGVIERLLTLDWLLSKNSRQPLKKCHPTVRMILRLGAYQIAFLQKIPNSAAVNEAVSQTKRFRQPYAAGYVNGVLRALSENAQQLLSGLPQDKKGTAIRYSVPLPLVESWCTDYGAQAAMMLAETSVDVPPCVLCINRLQTTREAFEKLLTENAVSYTPIKGLPFALCVDEAALRASAIPTSLYYIQDAASQWAIAALSPQAGDRVIDVCAAPGGKSLTAAQYMQNNGEILCCDIYDEKVKTLQKRAAAYGASCMHAVKRDASLPIPPAWDGTFDRVICDVPCSGFGVIRRRPEIRYKSPDDFAELVALQYEILCQSAALVKPGGVLQYSTCTLRKAENDQIAERFLAEHPSFSPNTLCVTPLFEAAGLPASYKITLMPHIHGTDGFFIASFRKGETP